MFNGEPLVSKERLVHSIHEKFSTTAIEPNPLHAEMVVQGRFPALREAVFGIGPAWPVEIDVDSIEAVAEYRRPCEKISASKQRDFQRKRVNEASRN